uniref:Uncharacterized protein n=1 Tax=Globodera rostochiensis TaxID=31243 RepID=A0A914HYB9_GLORO
MDSSLFFAAMAVLAKANLFPFVFSGHWNSIGCAVLLGVVSDHHQFYPFFFPLFRPRRCPHSFTAAFVFPLPFTVPIFNLDMFVRVQNDNVTFTLDYFKTENIFLYITAASFLDEQNNRYSLLQKWFGLNSDENQTLFLANFNQYPWVNDLSTVVIPAW